MRSVPPTFVNFLTNAPRNGLITQEMVSIKARHRTTGVEEWFCFYTGLDTYAFNVVSGETGTLVSRTFAGDGSVLQIGKSVRRSGLEYKNKTVTLSMLHPTVELMVRGYDLRMAPIEFHIGVLDPASRLFADDPQVDWQGFINEPNSVRPAPGSEGGVTFSCLSHSVELTYINPLMRAHEIQSQRSGDGLYKYLTIMPEVTLPWGMETSDTKPAASSGKKER